MRTVGFLAGKYQRLLRRSRILHMNHPQTPFNMTLNSSFPVIIPPNFAQGFLSSLLWTQAPYFIVSFVLLAVCLSPFLKSPSSVLLLNPKKNIFDVLHIGPKKSFFTEADGIIERWLSGNPVKAARINTWDGEVVLVPPHMVHEVKNERRLSLSLWLRKVSVITQAEIIRDGD